MMPETLDDCTYGSLAHEVMRAETKCDDKEGGEDNRELGKNASLRWLRREPERIVGKRCGVLIGLSVSGTSYGSIFR